jgi:hypothetical protein
MSEFTDPMRHKSSLLVEKEIEDARRADRPFIPALVLTLGTTDQNQWIGNALKDAQEVKEIALGRRPPRTIIQPNVAVSQWQSIWKTAHMNNNRELGPGDFNKRK